MEKVLQPAADKLQETTSFNKVEKASKRKKNLFLVGALLAQVGINLGAYALSPDIQDFVEHIRVNTKELLKPEFYTALAAISANTMVAAILIDERLQDSDFVNQLKKLKKEKEISQEFSENKPMSFGKHVSKLNKSDLTIVKENSSNDAAA